MNRAFKLRLMKDNPQFLAERVEASLAVNTDGKVLFWNSAAETLFGYKRTEAEGRNIRDLIVPVELVGDSLDGPTDADQFPSSYETLCRRRDESLIHVQVSKQAVPGADGLPKWILYKNRDITQTKTFRETRLLEERFGDLLECCPDPIVISDAASRIVILNEQAEAMFGYEHGELVGQYSSKLLPERFHSELRTLRFKILSEPGKTSSGRVEIVCQRKNGQEFPVQSSVRTLRTDEGTLMISALRDMSVRKTTDRKFEALMEAAPDAMVIVDPCGDIILVNTQAEKLFGYSRAELMGRPIEKLVPARLKAAHLALQSRGTVGDFYGVHRDGSEIPVEITLSPLETEDGLLIINAIRDETDKVATATRLALQTRELARSNSELDMFVRTASHDLKSPLRGIHQLVSWLEADLADDLKPETHQRLRLIRSRIGRMDALIADLLTYSQFGRLTDELMSVDTYSLVGQIYSMLAPQKLISLAIAGRLPTFVTLKTPLEIVLRNLLSNAIKHHDKARGRIEVSAVVHSDEYEFRVVDDGPGIAPEYHEKIFDMFQVLRPRDEMEGSGVGLALVRKAVQSVGGRITLTSSVGRGSEFRFTWPDETTLRARLDGKL